MKWYFWRKCRGLLLTALVAMLMIDIVYLKSGLEFRRFAKLGFDALNSIADVQVLSNLVFLFPLLFGLFIGSPAIPQEFEAKTHKLAWTQSISKTRWFDELVIKMLLIAAAFFILHFGIINWWLAPLIEMKGLFFGFPVLGCAPFFHSMMIVMAGITLGLTIGKTVLSMAAMIPTYLVSLIIFQLPIALLPKSVSIWDLHGENPISKTTGSWIRRVQLLDMNNRNVSIEEVVARCKESASLFAYIGNPEHLPCYRREGWIMKTTFIEESQFWVHQVIVALVCIVLGIGLYYLCKYWLRRKVV